MLTIVLADDHHVVRQGLRVLLESALPCTVVGEAADGRAAVTLVERLHPALLVVDMLMPDLNGLEVIRRVRMTSPQTGIVVLSMHADEGYVREALRAGATAYVLKEARADEFVHAIREAAAGRRYLSQPLSERALDAYIEQVERPNLDPYDALTARERDILHLSVQGATTIEIAERLTISSRTVEGHRASVLRKLGLRNQTDLVRFALRRGIIPMDQ
jgi:two-component system, NarL family, response regulator NreC